MRELTESEKVRVEKYWIRFSSKTLTKKLEKKLERMKEKRMKEQKKFGRTKVEGYWWNYLNRMGDRWEMDFSMRYKNSQRSQREKIS